MPKEQSGQAQGAGHGQGRHHAPYLRLLAMTVLSFLAMYLLMYAMVDRWDNVHHNINQAYMATLMTAPMVVFELALMRSMYPDRRFNVVILVAALVGLLLAWQGIRRQSGIDDRQFLKSMIPHHAGAVLMCERNRLRDPELRSLCREIVATQKAEIDLMRAKLGQPPRVVAASDGMGAAPGTASGP